MQFLLQRVILASILLSGLSVNQISIADSLTGMPPVHNPKNIYADAGAGMLASVVRNVPSRVYVPNSLDNTVSVIDPLTYKVVDTFVSGKTPQHVVPSYDLNMLYVLNNIGNSITPINPITAKPAAPIHVDDPYNLYFTPDGRYAIVVAEGHKRLGFYDAKTMALHDSVPVQCDGVNHMDFTADGKYALATCEFSGQILKLDVLTHKILGYISLVEGPIIHIMQQNIHLGTDGSLYIESDKTAGSPHVKTEYKKNSMPQDIRSAPDGSVFYVADMMMNGVFLIDPFKFKKIGFIPTGTGAHGIYPSRDGKYFYISNRGCCSTSCPQHGPGNISVLDTTTRKIIATWAIPAGGSPDMGNVSADGKELWLSGRYDSEVYVFDTVAGKLSHRIPVGRGPHGLTVWPQPGRYSLGHTGNMR